MMSSDSPKNGPAQREAGVASRSGRRFEATQRAIKDYIIRHRLSPDDLLPTEGQLAEELGIGRNSVREAVKALESLGIVGSRPGVGVFVRPFSFAPILDNLGYSLLVGHASVVELLDVRQQIEAGYVEIVAATATEPQIRVLRSVVDRMAERAARGESFPQEDRVFHRTLYSNLENQLLLGLLEIFWDVYQRLFAEAVIMVESDPVSSWEGHRQIVEALERHDGAAARAAMAAHFAGAKRRMREARLRADDSDAVTTSD